MQTKNLNGDVTEWTPLSAETLQTRRSKPGPLHLNEKGRQDRISESRTLPSQR